MKVKILAFNPYKISAERSADGEEKTGFVYIGVSQDTQVKAVSPTGSLKFSSTGVYKVGEEYNLDIRAVDTRSDGSIKWRDYPDLRDEE